MSNRKSFSPGALTAPLPPAIVTVGDGEQDNMLTVAWTGILATVPPKTYISVRPSRHSYGLLKKSGEFVINLPSADMAKTVDFVGIYTGAKMDKFERTGLTRLKSEKVLVPTVAECPVALECRVSEVLPMGSHDVFIADILSVSCREELLDTEGKLHFERANLLAYMHGEYYSLGECLGSFGFSTKKEDKKPRRTAERSKGKPQEAAEKTDGKRPRANVIKNGEKAPLEGGNRGDRKPQRAADKGSEAKPRATVANDSALPESEDKKEPFYLAVVKNQRGKRGRSNKR